MAMYNSHIDSHQDDSDITIINPSIIHEHNDEYIDHTYVSIITRLKQANNSSENRQTTNSPSNHTTNQNSKYSHMDGKNDYIFVDHDPLENAKHLEQVLTFYIRDLKQESNTQLDCDKQLVTRVMDLVRPAYLNDQQKMIQLDKIMEEIGLLHDKRHIEQKEKIEQLRTEICRLNKMLFTASNDQTIYNDNTRSYSMLSTIHRGHSMNDYDQWTEIEDDAKKLHELVQSQKNQINEIVTLISQTATAPTSLILPSIPPHRSEDVTTDKTPTPTPNSNINIVSSLLKKIEVIIGQQTQQEAAPSLSRQQTILENHSPGTSPSQSFDTLTLKTLTPSMVEPKTPVEEQRNNPIDIQEPAPVPVIHQEPPPPAPVIIPVTPGSPIESKKCPVCNHEFTSTSDDVEMYDHIEKCLFPTGIYTEPVDYECPNCNRKFPGNDETGYLEHLSDCYNRDT